MKEVHQEGMRHNVLDCFTLRNVLILSPHGGFVMYAAQANGMRAEEKCITSRGSF